MNRTSKTKLMLNRETLLRLDAGALGAVRGGNGDGNTNGNNQTGNGDGQQTSCWSLIACNCCVKK